jgi:hypothetical protein
MSETKNDQRSLGETALVEWQHLRLLLPWSWDRTRAGPVFWRENFDFQKKFKKIFPVFSNGFVITKKFL